MITTLIQMAALPADTQNQQEYVGKVERKITEKHIYTDRTIMYFKPNFFLLSSVPFRNTHTPQGQKHVCVIPCFVC